MSTLDSHVLARFDSRCIGALGRLTELHALVYGRLCGFDTRFETFVARELADFVDNFDAQEDCLLLWRASMNGDPGGKILGSVAIDGQLKETLGARLRFLIVDPDHQGNGVGGRLMQEALDFCQSRGMYRIFLWTTPALVAARQIYERFGFKLVEEVPHEDWGVDTLHQRFELELAKTDCLPTGTDKSLSP